MSETAAQKLERRLAALGVPVESAPIRSVLDDAYDEVRGASAWQPIETAPKDGVQGSNSRWLLLFGDGAGFASRPFIGYWGIPAGQPDAEECWRQTGWRAEAARPTHWLPLPAPPAE